VEGKQGLFVVNLGSRKMAGHISEGMLFDLGHADGLIPNSCRTREIRAGRLPCPMSGPTVDRLQCSNAM